MEIKIIIAYSSVVHISLIIVSLLLLRKVGLIGAWKPTMERWRSECRSRFVPVYFKLGLGSASKRKVGSGSK